jgi:hypothetical protein
MKRRASPSSRGRSRRASPERPQGAHASPTTLMDVDVTSEADVQRYGFRFLQTLVKEQTGSFYSSKAALLAFFHQIADSQHERRAAAAVPATDNKVVSAYEQNRLGDDVRNKIAQFAITECEHKTAQGTTCPTRITATCKEYCVSQMDQWVKTLLNMPAKLVMYRILGGAGDEPNTLHQAPVEAAMVTFFPVGYHQVSSKQNKRVYGTQWLYDGRDGRWYEDGHINKYSDNNAPVEPGTRRLTVATADAVIAQQRQLLQNVEATKVQWKAGFVGASAWELRHGIPNRPMFEYHVTFTMDVDHALLGSRAWRKLDDQKHVDIHSVCVASGAALFPSETWKQYGPVTFKTAFAQQPKRAGVAGTRPLVVHASMLMTLI